jgi:hypothetical protein
MFMGADIADAPAELPSLAEGLDSHENKMRTLRHPVKLVRPKALEPGMLMVVVRLATLRRRSMHNTENIREHMEVFGADGVHVGVVDRVEAPDRIKLTKSDPLAEGSHHFILADWIDHVDSKVHLNKDSSELMALWKHT